MPRCTFAQKRDIPFDQRCLESARVRERHQDRVPVIVERAKGSDVPVADK